MVTAATVPQDTLGRNAIKTSMNVCRHPASMVIGDLHDGVI